MNKFAGLLLASLVGTALIASPMAASAKEGQHLNAGWCKSGKKVFDVKNCKENGGKKLAASRIQDAYFEKPPQLAASFVSGQTAR
jgi:hypothetical protein